MTLDTFNDAFATIADAPGGIARLRALILQLAVQGRLVAQDAADEPASALLERVRSKQSQLIRQTPKDESEEETRPNLTWDNLPISWSTTTLGDITEIVRGITFPAAEKHKTKLPKTVACLRTTNVQDEIEWEDLLYISEIYVKREDQWLQEGDIIISMANSKELVGKVALATEIPQKSTFGGFLSAIRTSEMNKQFLHLLLRSPIIRGHIRNTSSQTVNIANISLGGLRPICVPVPPLAEQRRIVERVDQLMAHCDALEAQQAQQGNERRRLLAALIDELLAASAADAVDAAWARLRDSFDLLLDAPESVAPLRQAVLQLAVQGRLVAQDAADEPASVLLERVQAEKARLMKEGRLKKVEPVSPIAEEDQPFSLPQEWTWTRIGETCYSIEAGWSPLCDPHPAQVGEWAVLKISAVSWDRFKPQENKRLLPQQTPRPEYEVRKGDFLMSRANTAELVAKSVVVEHEVSNLMLSDKVLRVHFSPKVDLYYANLVNNSNLARTYYAKVATGTSDSMKNVTRQQIRDLPFPLPPLAEQRRIVERVDALMALCDALEAQLREERAAAARLAEALCAAVAAEQPSHPADRSDPPARRQPANVIAPAEHERIPTIATNGAASPTNGTLTQATLDLDARPANSNDLDTVQTLLAERGALTNSDLQAALGIDAAAARVLLRQLVAAGRARQEGERRGARYVRV